MHFLNALGRDVEIVIGASRGRGGRRGPLSPRLEGFSMHVWRVLVSAWN